MTAIQNFDSSPCVLKIKIRGWLLGFVFEVLEGSGWINSVCGHITQYIVRLTGITVGALWAPKYFSGI